MPSPEPVSNPYIAPIEDILGALDLVGLPGILDLEEFDHVAVQDVEIALKEFARLAAEVIAPTDRIGDLVGARLDPETNEVVTPAPFHDAYRHYVQSGWGTLQFPEIYGGAGFPAIVGLAIQEMFASANVALSLNPVLTQGAIELLLAWGTEAQRQMYLPKMLTGQWTGTMALTEADAGSDLGELRTRAELGPDGRWRITGTKIFITWGEHDLADNIIHLVLAKIPGGPPGSRGISTFVVPKFLVGNDGKPGPANSVTCTRLERKLGIHGSPTCVMEFDQAIGEIVGPEHGGLHAMFTMMNAARLSIGLEGPAIGERAYQHAFTYAAERLQGRAGGSRKSEPSPIIEHPDVRRMLLDMRTRVLAGRLLIFQAGAYGDIARHGPDKEARELAQAFADLLTPVAKAWSSDAGVTVASLGIQVLGGTGFVEESGMAQHLRDARIGPIYEGTNGIQAIDLVTRKIGRDGGRWTKLLLDDIQNTLLVSPRDVDDLELSREILVEAHQSFSTATNWMLERLEDNMSDVLAGATSYLELAGITIGGWLMLRRAEKAYEDGKKGRSVAECNFFVTETTARAAGLLRPITSGAERLDALPLAAPLAHN